MNTKRLKYLIPLICYLLFVGLFIVWDEITDLIYNTPPPEGPSFPNSFAFVLFFPLIPIGYLFLPLVEWGYRRNPKRFPVFAGIGFFLSYLFVLLLCSLWTGRIDISSLLFVLRMLSFYSIPYLFILYYTLKQEGKPLELLPTPITGKPKTLKYLTPSICYLLFVGLSIATFGIESGDLRYILLALYVYSPLIAVGYLFLPLVEWGYRRNPKRFPVFAGTVFLLSYVFVVLIKYLRSGDIPVSSLFYLLLALSFYVVPYLFILYYVLKKEQKQLK